MKTRPKYLDRGIAKEYIAWCAMKARCYQQKHKAFADYGGRGITVCASWRESYETFLADVGPAPSDEHSIGRIDNDGNYEPGNVEWQTREQQNSNQRTRRTSRRYPWRDGSMMTIGQMAKRLGISGAALAIRIKLRWSWEQIWSTEGLKPRPQKEICSNGHPLSGDNLYVFPAGKGRLCKQCGRDSHNRRRRERLTGLATKSPGHRAWTPAEDAAIRERARGNVASLATELGRTASAVYSRAAELKKRRLDAPPSTADVAGQDRVFVAVRGLG